MTDPLIGARMTTPPRYIDHPPASSSLWANGRPMDAGTEMILRSDLAHLAEESLRHLVTDGNPQMEGGNATSDGWNDLTDSTRPAGGASPTGVAAADSAILISWDQRTATSYGPFNLIADHTITAAVANALGTGTAGGRTIRNIRVRVEANFTHALDQIFVALTCGDGQTPSDGVVAGCFGWITNPGAPGTIYGTVDLACAVLAETLATTHSKCRPSPPASGSLAGGIADISLPMGTLWVGRYPALTFNASSVTVYSVAAWEIL